MVRTSDWKGITKAAWIPPDSLVDTARPEFAFLVDRAKSDGIYRVKAMKLRGVLSFGLLIPMPDDAELGKDVAEQFGVTHYEPPLPGESKERGGLVMGGDTAPPPSCYTQKYDLDAFRKYAHKVFDEGEPVFVTEKIHGSQGRYTFSKGEMYCGSKNEWKKEFTDYSHITVEHLIERSNGEMTEEKAKEVIERLNSRGKKQNMWWQALDATPNLRKLCEENPDVVVYGEVYGAVQDLTYGFSRGEVAFRAFDIMVDGKYLKPLDAVNMAAKYGVDWVPIFNKGYLDKENQRLGSIEGIPFDFDALCEMAEGKTTMPGANHVREGVVVCPMEERRHDTIGRVKLKIVGAGYLEKSK